MTTIRVSSGIKMMYSYPIVSEFGKSAELYELCAKKFGARLQIETWCRALTYSIIRCAEKTKSDYDQKLVEFNANAVYGEGLFLTPNIKITNEPNRTYVVLRWARIVNGTYIGRPSKANEWSVREISRAGRTHYSENDFRSVLNDKNMQNLDIILETEHIFRFLRIQYLLVGDLYKLTRKLNLPEFQNLLVKGDDSPLTYEETQKRQALIDKLSLVPLEFDPLNLPKAISLIRPKPTSVIDINKVDTLWGSATENLEF